MRLEKYLLKENLDVVLVEGDTNTVLPLPCAVRSLKLKLGM